EWALDGRPEHFLRHADLAIARRAIDDFFRHKPPSGRERYHQKGEHKKEPQGAHHGADDTADAAGLGEAAALGVHVVVVHAPQVGVPHQPGGDAQWHAHDGEDVDAGGDQSDDAESEDEAAAVGLAVAPDLAAALPGRQRAIVFIQVFAAEPTAGGAAGGHFA